MEQQSEYAESEFSDTSSVITTSTTTRARRRKYNNDLELVSAQILDILKTVSPTDRQRVFTRVLHDTSFRK